MPQKIYSLHIGVSYVDDNHYGNRLVPLPCCVTDAELMLRLANHCNYDQTKLLLNEEATVENLQQCLSEYSLVLDAGDLCVITYSGHGSTLPDLNEDEKEGFKDQTWCLYDRQLIDDELRVLWKGFNPGVNVFVLLDSCHSGTAGKNINDFPDYPLEYIAKYKNVKSENGNTIYLRNKALYDKLLKRKLVPESDIKSSVALLSACKDDEQALAGPYVSFFTETLLKTLTKQHKHLNNYSHLHEIVEKISSQQKRIHPNFTTFGSPSSFFEKTKPFLQKGDTFPKGLKSVFEDVLVDYNAIESKKLKDEGLLVDFLSTPASTIASIIGGIKNDNSKILQGTKGKDTPLYHMKLGTGKNPITHPWDKAYWIFDSLHKENKITSYIEPAFTFNPPKPSAKSAKKGANEYMKNWPDPKGVQNEFTWHLQNDYSQLADSRKWIIDNISEDQRNIKIGHVDTGVSPDHPGLPLKIGRGFSFVKGESDNPGLEKPKNRRFLEQDYHGTATMCILAGKEIPSHLAYASGDRRLGAAPFATIYPLRISDRVSLVLLLNNTVPFIKAVRKAIELKCEVISISMGGAPVKGWAKAVNEAYEAGITIVAAAGNSWVKGFKKLLPKKMYYPARYEQVIAATGVTNNQFPYDFGANPHNSFSKTANGEFMQGNYGPESAMNSAIAAYTPNIPWAKFNPENPLQSLVLKTGGGTSSATPQVAAAAAMWLIKNRKELQDRNYAGTWKQVEAVKQALFSSADKSYFAYKKYYGNGTLKAKAALEVPVPDEAQLTKAKAAKKASGLFALIKILILRKSQFVDLSSESYDDTKAEMILQEISQVLELDPLLASVYRELDLDDPVWDGPKERIWAQFSPVFEAVKKSPYASQYLKSMPRIPKN